MSSDLKPSDGNARDLRKRSVAAIELQDAQGRRRNTIQIEELSEADRALAEKFGYNPVRTFPLNAQCDLHHLLPRYCPKQQTTLP